MFIRATRLKYLPGTRLEMAFEDGKVFQYDLKQLFDKFPQLKALRNRRLFLSGQLDPFGIVWNDDLDLDAETVYYNGTYIRIEPIHPCVPVGFALNLARARANLSQSSLSDLTGISQADISRIERGTANPTLDTLARLAAALDADLSISFSPRN